MKSTEITEEERFFSSKFNSSLNALVFLFEIIVFKVIISLLSISFVLKSGTHIDIAYFPLVNDNSISFYYSDLEICLIAI